MSADRCRLEIARIMHHLDTGTPSPWIAADATHDVIVRDFCGQLQGLCDYSAELRMILAETRTGEDVLCDNVSSALGAGRDEVRASDRSPNHTSGAI